MWKGIVIILALAGAASATWLTIRNQKVPPPAPLAQEPVRNPYPRAIAGAGLVEPESEPVVIGVPEPGLVVKLWIQRGQEVKPGDPLFQLDARAWEAEKTLAEAAIKVARAEGERVRAFRRPEEEPALRAKTDETAQTVLLAKAGIAQAESAWTEARWNLKNIQNQWARLEVTVRAQAVPAEELDRMGFEVEMAKARVESLKAGAESARARLGMAEAGAAAARAELELFRAGPWGPDLARAQAALDEAQARVSRIEREIERRIVRAPLAATVLCCNLRQGEYLSAGMPIPEQAPIVLGNIGQWRVRVDVDEFDAPRFKPGLPASAFFKGQATPEIKLEFAGVEPYIVPKRALTNSQHEVVDTRILQVLFRILPPHPAIFSGQQMDVFIQTP